MESENLSERLAANMQDIEVCNTEYQKALSACINNINFDTIMEVINKSNPLINKLFEELKLTKQCFNEAVAYAKQIAESLESIQKNNLRLEDNLCSIIKIDLD